MSRVAALVVREEDVADDRPLLGLLPDLPDDRRFAFVQGDQGVVGWGVAARIPVGTGPERFVRARDGLARLAGGALPVAFASFTFDEDEDASVMIVPQVALVRHDGVSRTILAGPRDGVPRHIGAQHSDSRGEPMVSEAGRNADGRSGDGTDRPRYAGSTVRDDQWLEAVATALRRIGSGTLEKVVLARDVHLWSRSSFDVLGVLTELAERFPSCMTFLVDHLVGASPESLLHRSGERVTSRVLAGTAARGVDVLEDQAIGATLLSSEKDLREHGLALRSAIDALEPMCVTLDVPDHPSLVKLENVQHLSSDLVGTLDTDVDSHVLALLDRLHPTAAVGGAPRRAALQTIRDLEGMSRGRYAGPVGWCTPDGNGEFAIALRCAEIRGARARLFAGAGIVAGSLPEAELTETWLKLRAMTGVLDG